MLNITESHLKKAFFLILVILVVLNFFETPHSPHFVLDKFPGFWAIFGCGVAIIMAKVAKGAAHTFLGKNEDIYMENEKAMPIVDDSHHQEHH